MTAQVRQLIRKERDARARERVAEFEREEAALALIDVGLAVDIEQAFALIEEWER